MRTYSKALTEPSEDPSEPPRHKYTLRGVCTEPHVTYVLKKNNASASGDTMEVDRETNSGYQWWRISFSTEDGKTRQAQKREAQGDTAAAQYGDVVGYTARKVREIEVLKAAREEWRSVLLIYASDSAMEAKTDPAPPQLQVGSSLCRSPCTYVNLGQGFVNKDNEAFATELEQTTTGNDNATSAGASQQQQLPPQSRQQARVSDYEVPGPDKESVAGREMQEKAGYSLLGVGTGGAASNPAVSHALDDDSEWHAGDGDAEMVDHVENTKAL